MFATACRYPVSSRAARDGLALASGLVLAALVLVRIARALWPDLLAVGALALAAVPAVAFAGRVGTVLRSAADGDPDPSPSTPFALPLRTGIGFVAVAAVYLVGPTVVLLGTVVFLRAGAAGGSGTGGGRAAVAVAGTSALLVALALPAGLAVSARDGTRAALRVRSLPGLRSGAYFAAWAGAMVLVVLAWGALAAAGTGSILAVVAAVWFAYAHLAAARLAGEGLARATGRVRG